MNFLNKEYSKYHPAHKPWKNGLFSAAVLLFVFLLFQPFGFKDKEFALKFILFPVYSLLGFFYSIFNFFIVRRFINTKRRWTIKNELVYFTLSILPVTFLVHLLNVLFTGDMPLNLHWYFKLLYHVCSLFLIIAVVEYLYYSNRSARINIEHLSSRIHLVSQQLNGAKGEAYLATVTISLEKESIDINRSKMILIKSIGNYLEFYFRERDGQIKTLLKRGRLHQAEKDLESFPEFLRCHRAFIVNLKLVKQIRGNSKNATLVLDQKLEEIPVSRTQFKNIKEQLDKIIAG